MQGMKLVTQRASTELNPMHSARLILALSCTLIPVACVEQPADDDDAQTGGMTGAGTGGQGGSGGSAAGMPGAAGMSTTGGMASTGAGRSGVGGTPSTGGMSSTGGTGAGGMAVLSGGMGGVSAGRSGAGAGGGGMAGTNAAGAAGSAGAPAGGRSAAGGAPATGGAPTTGGMGGTGGTGTGGFDPCPATGPCKILPLGDSITDGIGFSGGYRVELFHLALEDDHEITYVGGSMNGPSMVDGVTFPKAHEGHSGWTISQIDGIVPDPALNVAPNIILLHIGTNDMYQTPSGAPDRLGTLIDQILMDLPEALLVVSNIIPLPSSSSQVTTFNSAVPGLVQSRKDAGKHIVFVDQFTGFPTGELGDGVHPNEAGYARMASKWYPAISAYLK
jgi:hypothetical protein